VLWLVTACLAVCVLLLPLYCRCRRFGTSPAASMAPTYAAFDRWLGHFTFIVYCLVGYAANLLPYTAVTRSCFVYHYMPALMYGELATAALLDALFGRRRMRWVAWLITACVLLSHLFFAQWVYSFREWPSGTRGRGLGGCGLAAITHPHDGGRAQRPRLTATTGGGG
jgi:dolichyl-phosphate-mannose--protein O-mannosyl transferase